MPKEYAGKYKIYNRQYGKKHAFGGDAIGGIDMEVDYMVVYGGCVI